MLTGLLRVKQELSEDKANLGPLEIIEPRSSDDQKVFPGPVVIGHEQSFRGHHSDLKEIYNYTLFVKVTFHKVV